jgi:hypothetical protein
MMSKVNTSLHYLNIVDEYNSKNDLQADLNYIISSMDIMCKVIENLSNTDVKTTFDNIDTEYYALKAMANTINYIKVMKPICGRFNPTEEDRAKLAEFIKKMEEEKDE